MGLQVQILNATSIGEIEAAFATMSRERPDALFVAPGGLFSSRRVQLATLAASYKIPATYPTRDSVEVGGLMSYGADLTDMFRQVGVYTGSILKGAKPAALPATHYRLAADYIDRILRGTKPTELPVQQPTKYELVVNLKTAKALKRTCRLHA
jgi:putative ABC transport system substrate-binding protein